MFTDHSNVEGVRAVFAELATIQAEMATVATLAEEDWRRALIGLRRRLQQQIGLVSNQLTLWADNAARAEVAKPLRNALDRMRTAVALHQANWPAVSIERGDPRYLASLADVRSTSQTLMQLADAAFGTMPKASS